MATDNTVTRTLLLLIAAIVLLPILMMAVMMPMMGLWGFGHMDAGVWGSSGGIWMWVVMWAVILLGIGAIGYVVYNAIRSSDSATSDPAIAELRAAYARGELSDEEFEERRERLQREE